MPGRRARKPARSGGTQRAPECTTLRCGPARPAEPPPWAHQLLGDVWEWTATDFHGYPGFRSWPYREYSEVFFGPEYKVLRGGSFGTDPAACRSTFRNWDYPIRRQNRWWTDEQELFSLSLWAAA